MSQSFEPHNYKSQHWDSERVRFLPKVLLLGMLSAAQSSDSRFLAFSKKLHIYFTGSGKKHILPTFLELRQSVFNPGMGLNVESGSWSSWISIFSSWKYIHPTEEHPELRSGSSTGYLYNCFDTSRNTAVTLISGSQCFSRMFWGHWEVILPSPLWGRCVGLCADPLGCEEGDAILCQGRPLWSEMRQECDNLSIHSCELNGVFELAWAPCKICHCFIGNTLIYK